MPRPLDEQLERELDALFAEEDGRDDGQIDATLSATLSVMRGAVRDLVAKEREALPDQTPVAIAQMAETIGVALGAMTVALEARDDDGLRQHFAAMRAQSETLAGLQETVAALCERLDQRDAELADLRALLAAPRVREPERDVDGRIVRVVDRLAL